MEMTRQFFIYFSTYFLLYTHKAIETHKYLSIHNKLKFKENPFQYCATSFMLESDTTTYRNGLILENSYSQYKNFPQL